MTAAAANEQEGPSSWGQDGANGSESDPTRPIAGPVSSLTGANNFNAGASPSENRRVSRVPC